MERRTAQVTGMRAREVDDRRVFGTAAESDVLWARRVLWLVKRFCQIKAVGTSEGARKTGGRYATEIHIGASHLLLNLDLNFLTLFDLANC